MAQEPTLGFGCAICSDTFDVNVQHNICTIASCGHVYHENCLKRWFRTQTQQSIPSSCPKCRVPATANQMIRLFLHQTISEDNDASTQEDDEVEVANSDDGRSFLDRFFMRPYPDPPERIYGRILVPESPPRQSTPTDGHANLHSIPAERPTVSDVNDNNDQDGNDSPEER